MRHSAIAVGVAWFALAPPALASMAPSNVRLVASTTDYTKRTSDSNVSGTAFLDVSAASAFDLAIQWERSRYFGWELAAGQLELDATRSFRRLVAVSFNPLVLREEVTVQPTEQLTMRPITVGLLVQTPRERRVSGYATPLVGFALYNVTGTLQERDPDLLYGAKVGAQVRFATHRWALSLEGRHLEVSHEPIERDLYGNMGILTIGVGLSYRFSEERH